MRVAVIGAGVTGVMTAYHLLKAGHEVTVFEKQPFAGLETSFANGGQLSASNAEVWNSAKNIQKALGWVFKPDAPLLIHPLPTWHKLSWFSQFVSAIPKHDQNTITTAKMAIESRSILDDVERDTDIQFDRRREGIVHFYSRQKDFGAAKKTDRLYQKAGLVREQLDDQGVKHYVPQIKADVVGGFFTESDSTGDAHKFTQELANWLVQAGVVFYYNVEVLKLNRNEDAVKVFTSQSINKFDVAVVCSGVKSKEISRQLGDNLNIYPVKGYSITIELDEASQLAAPTTSLLDDHAKIVTSRLGNRMRVAGTAEFAGFDKSINPRRVQPLLDWTKKNFPDINLENYTAWAGLRPMMPDMMPRTCKSRQRGIYYNTGHGHLGWTLSGVTAKRITQIINRDLN